MDHQFYLAPLRGITDHIFRSVYEKHFGKFDYIVTPFVSTVRGNRVNGCYFKDTLPQNNDIKRVIPQIIGSESDGFILLSHRYAQSGFLSVNWNLGCPAPLITRKKRGSGLLPHKEIIERFLDQTLPKLPIPLSIKVRLGLENKDDLGALIPIFNNYPIKEIIIHPRTGRQLYGGTVDIDAFQKYFEICKHPVVYNGDIQTVEFFSLLSNRFPAVSRWMIGRGVIINPNLLSALKGQVIESPETKPREFLEELLVVNKNILPQKNVLGKMKEMWRFLGRGLDESGKLSEKILHCASLTEYQKTVDDFFR
ncbi:MAG: tRNA-dihydrouridine synthase family protein [Chitinispirillales bacterium]|jgi:tRNA-dihydrouridine synthase|nr:tRNA-dihydrouridine synthase family protein [Chitinispirillales bacterium]